VVGIGVDLVECARIGSSLDRFGEKFLRRVFTEGEIEYSMSMKFPARHRKKRSGEPFLVFSGPAQELASKRGVTSALITLSHTEHHAMACVVLEA